MGDFPVVFVDHEFPDEYRDLVDGRLEVVGGASDVGLDRADAILAGAVRRWDAVAFALAPRARLISRVGVGYDNVVVADAIAAGMVVCNTPQAPAVSTAEHTVALLLAVTKHLPRHTRRAREGLPGEKVGVALELDGRVLGLLGIGRIASRVAAAAQGLGMDVIATDPGVDASPVPGVELVQFDELLARSDVVTLHVSYSDATRHLIGATELARMRPHAVLVNTSRGGLVDEAALLHALATDALGGAALDVLDGEPAITPDHPVLRAAATDDRLLVTPHLGGNTAESFRRTEVFLAHRVVDALRRAAPVPSAPGPGPRP